MFSFLLSREASKKPTEKEPCDGFSFCASDLGAIHWRTGSQEKTFGWMRPEEEGPFGFFFSSSIRSRKFGRNILSSPGRTCQNFWFDGEVGLDEDAFGTM
jgi:hypothetical protein